MLRRLFSWKRVALFFMLLTVGLVLILFGLSSDRQALLLHRGKIQAEVAAVMSEDSSVGMLIPILDMPKEISPSWLICEGQLLAKAEYPELYASVGDLHAHGDWPDDQFGLPDMRGGFHFTLSPDLFPWYLKPFASMPMTSGNLLLGRRNPINATFPGEKRLSSEVVWVVKAR